MVSTPGYFAPSPESLAWIRSQPLLRFMSEPGMAEKYLHLFETGNMTSDKRPLYVGETSRSAKAQNDRFRKLLDDGLIVLHSDPVENIRLRAARVPSHIPEVLRMHSPYVSQAEYNKWRADRTASNAVENALRDAREMLREKKEREDHIADVNGFADRSVERDLASGKYIPSSTLKAYFKRHPVDAGLDTEVRPQTYFESPEVVRNYTPEQRMQVGLYASDEMKRAVMSAGATYLKDEEYEQFLKEVYPERYAEIDKSAAEEAARIVEASAGIRQQTTLEVERDKNLVSQAKEFLESGNYEYFNSFLERVKKDTTVAPATKKEMEDIGASFNLTSKGAETDFQRLAHAQLNEYYLLMHGGESSAAQLDILSQRIAGLPPVDKIQLNRQFEEARNRIKEGRKYSPAMMAAFERFYADLNSDFGGGSLAA